MDSSHPVSSVDQVVMIKKYPPGDERYLEEDHDKKMLKEEEFFDPEDAFDDWMLSLSLCQQ